MKYEQLLEVKIAGVVLHVTRRSISIPPIDGCIGLIDFGTFDLIRGQRVGLFRNGEWRTSSGGPLKEQPTHWTSLDKDNADVAA